VPNYSAANDIRAYLVNLGYSDVYVNAMPDSPDVAICCYDYSGARDEMAMGSKNVQWNYPRVQIVVRDTDNEACYNRSYAIYKELSGAIDVTSNNTYKLITALQLPFLLGAADESGRYRYVCNYSLVRDAV
jgi:hypothetical protein